MVEPSTCWLIGLRKGKKMKKIVVAAFIAAGTLFSQPLLAQNTSAATVSDQDVKLLRKDLRSQKKQIVAANMTLTEAEALKFWPVYDQYAAELSKVNDTRLSLINDYAANYESLSDTKAQSVVEQWLAADEAAAQLRIKYVPIVRQVLPGKKAARFFQVDRRISTLVDLQLASAIPLVEP